jgi:hypothetical protein
MEHFSQTTPVQIRWDDVDYVVEQKPGMFFREVAPLSPNGQSTASNLAPY